MSTKETSFIQRAAWICNTLVQQSIAVISIYIFWVIFKNYDLNSILTWHMFLCTVAYVPLMAEAIILFSGDNLWSQNISRTTKYVIHGAFLFVSCIMVTIGIFILTHEKGSSGRHFKSDHALSGLISWIFVVISILLGFLAMKAQSLKNFLRPVYFKFAHNIIGMVGYVAGVVSLGYGLYLGSFLRLVTEESVESICILMGIVLGWSLLAAFKSAFNQLRTIANK